MKLGAFLLLFGLALDISAAAFLPLSDVASGQNPGCYMPSQPKCLLTLRKVGCYRDSKDKRAFPELLITARDSMSSVYYGEKIDWDDWANFISNFTCACAMMAKQKNYEYFGIEYFGECWGGVNPNYSYDAHGDSDNCHMIKEDECAFEPCEEQGQDSRLCVGGRWTLFVYSVEMPTPPPPPPPTTLPPPPPPSIPAEVA